MNFDGDDDWVSDMTMTMTIEWVKQQVRTCVQLLSNPLRQRFEPTQPEMNNDEDEGHLGDGDSNANPQCFEQTQSNEWWWCSR